MTRRATLWTGTALLIITTSALTLDRARITAAHVVGPPPAHTGGFNEPTCAACHSEFSLNQQTDALQVTGLPNRYAPGGQYIIEVALFGNDMVVAGFQASIRFAGGTMHGQNAGSAAPLDNKVAVIRHPDTGVDYIQHTGTGIGVVQSGAAHWGFVWTAPHSTEPLELSVAANDANGDNSPLGDFVYATETRTSGESERGR
jgi:hypothetical protein